MANDLERLKEAMKRYAEGDFEPENVAAYEDPEVARAFNDMVAKDMERNNRFLARINDAQLRIGDSSCMKAMLEEIANQQDAINRLQEYQRANNPESRPTDAINRELLGLAEQIREIVEPCLSELKEGLACMEAGETDPSFYKDRYSYTFGRLMSLEVRTEDLARDAEELYEVIDSQLSLSEEFLNNVDTLTDSYKNLSANCLDTGRHLYRISRDIDNARNDMFRHFSRPTIHDRLRVYEVDHVTLGWRLYNNLVEFESLRVTQVNNPKGCKLGLWLEANKNDPLYVHADAFGKLYKAHELFHEKCVACYEAKQNFDRALALEKFGEIMDALALFQEAMAQMHEYLRSVGITDETDVWKFRG